MKNDIARLYGVTAVLLEALMVALATHPNRQKVLKDLTRISERSEALNLGVALPDAALESSRVVFADLIKQLKKMPQVDPAATKSAPPTKKT